MGARITIEGNLGAMPELNYADVMVDGEVTKRSVCELSVFQSHERKDKQTGEYIDAGGFWCDVSVWGRKAESLAKLLSKGNPVRIDGEAHIHPWTDNEGNPRQTVKVVTHDVALQLYNVEAITFRERPVDANVAEAVSG